MFSGVVIGILVAASAATWVYAKVMRRTGNNTQNALITAGFAGVAAFIFILTIVSFVNNATGN